MGLVEGPLLGLVGCGIGGGGGGKGLVGKGLVVDMLGSRWVVADPERMTEGLALPGQGR